MITERYFATDHQRVLKLYAQHVKAPSYFYQYDFGAEHGFENLMPNITEDLGVAHGDDILLIYSTAFRVGPLKLNSNEIIMQQKLLDLYESFMANEYINY